MAHDMKSFEHMICKRNVSLLTVMVHDAPWFRGNNVAHALDYVNHRQAIRQNVDEEDRVQLKDLGPLSESGPLKHNEGAQVFISESGPYRTRFADLGRPSDGRPLKHNEGVRLLIAYTVPSLRTTQRFQTSTWQRFATTDQGTQIFIFDIR